MKCEGCERRKKIAREALIRAAMGIKKALGIVPDSDKTEAATAAKKDKKGAK